MAYVQQPLLGADFLAQNHFMAEVAGKRLVDTESFRPLPIVGRRKSGIREVAVCKRPVGPYSDIVDEFHSKQPKINDSLQSMNEAIDENEQINAGGDSTHERYWKDLAGLLVLPLLLGEDENILIREYPDTATLDKMTEDGPTSPYNASQRNPLNLTTDYFIILENECILRTNELTDALILIFMLFYVFWLEYPKRVCCTLKYIQTIVFERNATEEGNMPSKLLRLINTIHN